MVNNSEDSITNDLLNLFVLGSFLGADLEHGDDPDPLWPIVFMVCLIAIVLIAHAG
jgi:hypothetical protein